VFGIVGGPEILGLGGILGGSSWGTRMQCLAWEPPGQTWETTFLPILSYNLLTHACNHQLSQPLTQDSRLFPTLKRSGRDESKKDQRIGGSAAKEEE
jgi:hypothetical protein